MKNILAILLLSLSISAFSQVYFGGSDQGATVTLTSNQTITDLDVRDGGTLNLDSYTLTVTEALGGDVEIRPGGTINGQTGTIIFDGLFEISNDTANTKYSSFNAQTSTVEWNGSSDGFSIIRNNFIFPDNGIVEFYNLTINPTVNTAEFEISSSSIVSVSVTNVLSVIDGDLITNDKLILKATSPTQYGRLKLNDEGGIGARTAYTGTITGGLTVEKNFATTLQDMDAIPGNGQFEGDWFNLCAPVNSTLSDWSGISLNPTNTGTPPIDTRNIWYWNSSDAGGGIATGWETSTTFDYGEGYTVFLTNTNNGSPWGTSQTISVEGTVDLATFHSTPIVHNLDYTEDPSAVAPTGNEHIGWNMIANPFPGVIETDFWLDATEAAANFDVDYLAIHAWNTVTKRYDAWTNTNFTTYSVIDYNTNGVKLEGSDDNAGDYRVPPFQAFWVKAGVNAAKRDITLKSTYYTTDINGINFQKTTSALPETAMLIVYDTDSMFDGTLMYYQNGKTDNFDYQGDIYKFFSLQPDFPNLYVMEAGNKAQSAGRAPKAIDTVDVGYASIKNNTVANFYFNDTALSSSFDVELYDKVTGAKQDLIANNNYQFTHNTSYPEKRFQLIITNKAFSTSDINTNEGSIKSYVVGEELFFESFSYTGPADFVLYDLNGRIIMNRTIQMTAGARQSVHLPSMARSIYMIEISFDGQAIVEKLIN